MGKSIDPIRLVPEMRDAELLNSTLRPIVSMSFQLAIFLGGLRSRRARLRFTNRELLCTKGPPLAIKNQRTVNCV